MASFCDPGKLDELYSRVNELRQHFVTKSDKFQHRLPEMLSDILSSLNGACSEVERLRERNEELELSLSRTEGERDKCLNIFNCMEDFVYIVNKDHEIEYVNPNLAREFGPIEGLKCHEYLHGRAGKCPWCKSPAVFLEGKPIRWEWYWPENEKIYDIIEMPLTNPDGTVSKMKVFRDITALKRAEKALQQSEARHRHLSQNLEKTVAEKVAELRQVESLANLGKMISIVAHEVRNPLQNIQMGVESLRTAVDEETKQELLEEIIGGVGVLDSIITDLLEYSKPMELQCASCSVASLVAEALKRLSHRLERVSVRVDLEKEDRIIYAHENKLIQVLINLISNAIEAMAGEGELHISSQIFQRSGDDRLKISVSDSGCGIAAEELDRIHEPFFTTKSRGVGLGFSISQKIVEAHGGLLRVRSDLSRGTTVDIELPLSCSCDNQPGGTPSRPTGC